MENIVKLAVILTFDRFSGIENNIEKRLKIILKIAEALNIDYEQVSMISNQLILRMAEIAESMNIENPQTMVRTKKTVRAALYALMTITLMVYGCNPTTKMEKPEAIENLVQAIAEGREPSVNALEARKAVALICAIYESAQHDGKKVRL